MHFRTFLLIMALTGPVACTDIPVLEGTSDAEALSAPFPTLVPIASLLATAPGTSQITQASTTALNARITALRSRAAGLNEPVVDTTTRSRMQGAIARAALR